MTDTLALEELRKDHTMLRREIAALEATVNRLGERPLARREALGGSFRGSLADFGGRMELHFRREEEAFFPHARRMASEEMPAAEVIGQFLSGEAEDDLSAHTGLRTRLAEMIRLLEESEAEGELDEEKSRRLRTLFSLFRSVLVLHAAKEDDLIFPIVEHALTPSERDAVVHVLGSIPIERSTEDRDTEG
jgi:hemerythrin-like domain-containing protein